MMQVYGPPIAPKRLQVRTPVIGGPRLPPEVIVMIIKYRLDIEFEALHEFHQPFFAQYLDSRAQEIKNLVRAMPGFYHIIVAPFFEYHELAQSEAKRREDCILCTVHNVMDEGWFKYILPPFGDRECQNHGGSRQWRDPYEIQIRNHMAVLYHELRAMARLGKSIHE